MNPVNIAGRPLERPKSFGTLGSNSSVPYTPLDGSEGDAESWLIEGKRAKATERDTVRRTKKFTLRRDSDLIPAHLYDSTDFPKMTRGFGEEIPVDHDHTQNKSRMKTSVHAPLVKSDTNTRGESESTTAKKILPANTCGDEELHTPPSASRVHLRRESIAYSGLAMNERRCSSILYGLRFLGDSSIDDSALFDISDASIDIKLLCANKA
eukprot:CAMPEP_0197439868 /NCGR_PEP_ID=MMETSP1175-20131217/6517_1 /TAXON_ID=1003142 /ORGANISM="Triceratium dubium, Strain CCMP147" /LENGTH=209 /DNA_ID=CAMNT_0042969865 /DNA_START=215 /DNA_END=844 /DNA_ORIENTATION=-